jgi:uncharacterized membrane protein
MARVVARNIQALLARRHAEEQARRSQDRLADRITAFTGSMAFVAIHLVLYALWIAVNLGWLSRLHVPRFDPSFVILAMEASVEAIFLSTFVLISQNRMTALADKRADLDLQVSLLAEHEVTRLISLVTAMAQKMGIEEAGDPELAELAQDVAPERVLDEMEAGARKVSEGAP